LHDELEDAEDRIVAGEIVPPPGPTGHIESEAEMWARMRRHGRGENALAGRRAELRKLAHARIEAAGKRAKQEIRTC